MRKTWFCLVLLVVLLASFSCVSAAERWAVIEDNQNATMFFDTKSITVGTNIREKSPDKRIISCWTKFVVNSDDFRKIYIQEIKKNYPNINPYRISYALWKWNIDPESNEISEEIVIYYDSNNSVVLKEKILQSWEKIEPGSPEEKIIEIAKAQLSF